MCSKKGCELQKRRTALGSGLVLVFRSKRGKGEERTSATKVHSRLNGRRAPRE